MLIIASSAACSSGDGAGHGVERTDGAVQLAEGDHRESLQNPCFSPEGDALAFTVFQQGYNDGPAGVYRTSFDEDATASSSREVLLFDDGQDAVNLPGSCWVEGRLVVSSDRGGRTGVWVLDPEDADSLEELSEPDGPGSAWEPSLAPDAGRVVFEAHREEDGSDPGDLYVADLERVNTDALVVDDEYDDRQPNWSPDGAAVVFQRRRAGEDDWDLWIIEPDGEAQGSPGPAEQLTDVGDATDASWSPDGEALLFSAPGHDGIAHLWVLYIESGSVVQLTSDAEHGDGAASWSPDGSWIVFESYPVEHDGDGEPAGPASLWAIAAPDAEHG
ncbi:MAG: Protein TolB [Acidimicrobiales bacterium]|nr:Protein TolB [Acidimicrobiales bacterium]